MTKKQVGEERIYSAYTSILLFITKGSQDWNSNRSGSRSWCRGHGGMFFTGLLPLPCSACSLIESKTTSPEMVPPTRGLSPLITNWDNALQLDLMEAFPQLKLLSLWYLQLCQVDTKLASTQPLGNVLQYIQITKNGNFKHHCRSWAVLAHAFHPSTGEADAGDLQIELEDSQGYSEKPCFRNKQTNETAATS